MKQAVYTGYGDVNVIEIVDSEVPKLNEDEILIKVKAMALNPKDVMIRKGKFKSFSGERFPMGIGFDFAGYVMDPNGRTHLKGAKVFGMLNGWRGRTCAEYLNVHIDEVYTMPEDLTYEEAAGIPLVGQTALQAIRDIGNLQSGKKILINGASGGVGSIAIQIARAMGGEVTSISSTRNLDFCKFLGAHSTISYSDTDRLESESGYDIFFDVFGNFSFSKVSKMLSKEGRYITTVPKRGIFFQQMLNPFRSKKAKMVYVKSNRKDLQWLHEKLREEDIKPVIDRYFTMNELKEAQDYIETKRAKGKIIIVI